MNQNRNKIILVVILLVATLAVRLFRHQTHGHTTTTTTTTEPHQTTTPTDTAPAQPTSGEHQTVIDPGASLIYTRHARCRMDCRHISEADIKEVLREGHVNEAKSQQNESPCPTYAIEDNRNKDGIRLRIVFAKCENAVKVVTCIDRDDEFACDCK